MRKRRMHRGDGCGMLLHVTTGTRVRQYLVSTIASLERWHPGDPRLPALRAQLAAEGLAEHIERVTDSVTLTSQQRAQLAALLAPDTTGHA
jgi:hypothetical protein